MQQIAWSNMSCGTLAKSLRH